jgi:hypothetical protein
MIMIDSYFDLNDFDQTIKTFLTEKYYYRITPTWTKYGDIFLEKNEVELQDGIFRFGSSDKEKFYSVSGTRQDTSFDSNGVYVSLKLQLDPENKIFKRTVFSFMDMLAQIGGVFGIVQSIMVLLLGVYAERMLIYSVLSK